MIRVRCAASTTPGISLYPPNNPPWMRNRDPDRYISNTFADRCHPWGLTERSSYLRNHKRHTKGLLCFLPPGRYESDPITGQDRPLMPDTTSCTLQRAERPNNPHIWHAFIGPGANYNRGITAIEVSITNGRVESDYPSPSVSDFAMLGESGRLLLKSPQSRDRAVCTGRYSKWAYYELMANGLKTLPPRVLVPADPLTNGPRTTIKH